MIVRDIGDAWQVVLQTDHAVLSEQFCRAWGNEVFAVPQPLESLAIASLRHDDGWSVWEQSPSLEGESKKPQGFLDVKIPLHLAFYRACIAAVSDQDPYAGLLVSMHGAGIYRGRYGSQDGLRLTHAEEVKDLVDAFVVEQEAGYQFRIHALKLSEEERWANYRLLQIYDRLSLYFCMKDIDAGTPETLSPVPINYSGQEVDLKIEPVGHWRVSIDPFPFVGMEATFFVDRRVIPKSDWVDDGHFREVFFATPVERISIVVVSG